MHSNMWYAEYTHEQAIRQFVKLYEKILDVFEKHQGGAGIWDFDTQITLDILRESSPQIIQRLDAFARKGLHELIPCSWGTALTTHMPRNEFDFNMQESLKAMHNTFHHVSPSWTSQDGGYSPQFVPILKQLGMQYYLLDHRILHRHYGNNFDLMDRFRPNLIVGQGDALPCLFIGIEGLNSYGDFAEAVKIQLEKLNPIREQHPEKNFLILPFIDAERIDPPKLDKWLTKIEALGIMYCTPSQFLKIEPNSNTKFEFDVGDWHDWSFHNDILADQRLWTAIEKARDKLEEAHWWETQIQKFKIPIAPVNYQKYTRMLDEANREINIATGSDKSHWYASPHKMEIGQQYAISSFEKASYVSGIYSYALAQANTFLPNRPQAMKDTTLNLTLLNPFQQFPAYPSHFPAGFEFPYIVTVNLNTPPMYEIRDFPAENWRIQTPTVLNIIPGLNVNNFRTEVFYQLNSPLEYGKTCALKLVPSENDHETTPASTTSLENEFIKVEFTELGDVSKIIDKRTDGIYSCEGGKDFPLISTHFDCQIVGAENNSKQCLKVIEHESDLPLSLIIIRQSNEKDGGHRLHLATKYRLFPQFPGIMIDSIANIAGPLPGYYCPCELDWCLPTPSDISITREVLSEVFTSPQLLPKMHQIFLNDWAIINNKKLSLGFAFDKKIHSCKQILFTPASPKSPVPRFSIGFMRNFPGWVAQNLLSGVVFQRIWVMPFEKNSDDKKNAKILQMLSKPPVVGWYL